MVNAIKEQQREIEQQQKLLRVTERSDAESRGPGPRNPQDAPPGQSAGRSRPAYDDRSQVEEGCPTKVERPIVIGIEKRLDPFNGMWVQDYPERANLVPPGAPPWRSATLGHRAPRWSAKIASQAIEAVRKCAHSGETGDSQTSKERCTLCGPRSFCVALETTFPRRKPSTFSRNWSEVYAAALGHSAPLRRHRFDRGRLQQKTASSRI